MYLSRMKLDLSLRKTMMALASPSLFHGAVESSFADRGGRKLWRIDHLNGSCYLLLLSADEPDLTSAVSQFGFQDEGWETKDYAPLLARVANESVWRFRLAACPSWSKTSKDPAKRGTVLAHTTVEHQKEWLASRAEKHGFALGPDSFDVVHSKREMFQKGGRGKAVTLMHAIYEGVLTVSDAELFCTALTCGIGRAKAYGMGLMTIIPYARTA